MTVNHEKFLKQLLEKDPLFQAALKTQHRKMYDEAQRLLKEGYVKWIESDPGGRLYYVAPVLYKVKEMKDGSWICQCENFSKYGLCEHVLAVKIKEGE